MTAPPTAVTGADGADVGSDDDGTDAEGFSAAAIIHGGAGGFVADPKYGIPAAANFNESDGGIKSSVQRALVTKDGDCIWFATQDGNGSVGPQLFCINSDGTGIQEFDLPATLQKLPSEIWPSADGNECALIIDACGGGGCSGYMFTSSVILQANRTTGNVTTLFDARNIEDGEDDYFNLQLNDEGTTLWFQGWDTGVVYTLPATGGTPSAFLAPASFTRSGSVPQGPEKFRVNGDGTALLAVVRFEGPDDTFPQDVYLWTGAGITALTSTGDAYVSAYHPDLGLSDDARYVAYTRHISDESRYQVEVVDRSRGTTTIIVQGSGGYATLLDCDATVLFTGYQPYEPTSNTDQLPALGTLDGSSALEFHEAWLNHYAAPVAMTSMSAGGEVLVGIWDNGDFGDPNRLYAWFPGATSYRSGPSITSVSCKFDAQAGTLTVRATVSGAVTSVLLYGFYDGFESIYQLAETQDPFFTERWGQDLTEMADSPTVHEYTVDLDDLTLDTRFRVRVGVGDNTAKNFAYMDFRPVPIEDETVDLNGDGVGD